MDKRQLQELLQNASLPIVQWCEGDQIGTLLAGRHGVPYRVNLGLIEGQIGITTQFSSLWPSPGDLAKLKDAIQSDSPGVTVQFLEDPSGIRLQAFIRTEQFLEEVERFADACDIAYAVALHIRDDIGVNDHLLRLARCETRTMPRA